MKVKYKDFIDRGILALSRKSPFIFGNGNPSFGYPEFDDNWESENMDWARTHKVMEDIPRLAYGCIVPIHQNICYPTSANYQRYYIVGRQKADLVEEYHSIDYSKGYSTVIYDCCIRGPHTERFLKVIYEYYKAGDRLRNSKGVFDSNKFLFYGKPYGVTANGISLKMCAISDIVDSTTGGFNYIKNTLIENLLCIEEHTRNNEFAQYGIDYQLPYPEKMENLYA